MLFLSLLAMLAFVQVALGQLGTNLPVFPNNIICFPERDFCSIDSFADYAGKDLILEVTRPNVGVTGGAVGRVSGGVVAFEVNHPGGYCWGAGMPRTLQVTPDIKPGDIVSLRSGLLPVADMRVLDGHITEKSLSGTVITVKGVVALDVDRANIEARIVNGDWQSSTIGRRDVRAIVGAPVVNPGITTQLVFDAVDPTLFTATFTFTTTALAEIGDVGAFSLSMWQFTDAGGNADGLTISEFGESGGPFSFSCPAAADMIDPVLPSDIVVNANTVKWVAAYTIPGTKPVTGYQIEIVKPDQSIIAQRVGPTVTQFDFPTNTVTPGDTLEIRTFQENRKTSDSYAEAFTAIAATSITLTSTPVANGLNLVFTDTVTFQATTDQIVYTTDGTEPFVNNKLSPSAIVYDTNPETTTPIVVTADTIIRAAAFDTIDPTHFTPLVIHVTPGFSGAPPTVITTAPVVNVVSNAITITWAAPVDSSITNFLVDLYDSLGNVIGLPFSTQTPNFLFTVGTPGTDYKFGIRTVNAIATSVSSPLSALIKFPVPSDAITITFTKYVVNKELRIQGTGNVNGAIISIYNVNADNSAGTQITSTTGAPLTATVGACVAGVCTWEIRPRNNIPSGLTRIIAKSDKGGVTPPWSI